jgi:hypothetical protein
VSAVAFAEQGKGDIWPGMDIFDSATPDMRRKRNQKKATSVIVQFQATSEIFIPAELIFDNLGQFKEKRVISGELESERDGQVPRDLRLPRGTVYPPPQFHTAVCWEAYLRLRLTACTPRQVHWRELPARNEHRAVGAGRDSERTTKEQLEFSESANGQRAVVRRASMRTSGFYDPPRQRDRGRLGHRARREYPQSNQ